MARGKRRRVVGVVTSDRMKKSVVVEVTRLVRHPLYGKYMRRRAKVMAHDEENSARVGDRVELVQTRPLSKRKSWRVLQILVRAPQDATPLPTPDELALQAASADIASRPVVEKPSAGTPEAVSTQGPAQDAEQGRGGQAQS
jgi:small subunit ribosomal protein S17